MGERAKTKEARERALFFYTEFKNLIDAYKKLDSCALNEITEIIEATQDSYDYVWQQVDFDPPYSQDRMTNLLEITGMSILRALLNRLAKVKAFEAFNNYSEIKEALKHAINVCERWIECCHNLTGRIWKSSQTHKWENEKFSPVAIVEYGKRLTEVLAIRSSREQYLVLIKTVKEEKDDEESSKIANNLSAFDNLDVLHFNPFSEPAWREAVQVYDRSMSQFDQRAAQILKMHLRQAQSNPRQV